MPGKRIPPSRYRCAGIPLGSDKEQCDAREGKLHELGCDVERCSQCSDQYLYCDCPEPRDERRRAPFFQFPLRCHKCGVDWPEFFNVPSDVWKYYVLDLGQGDKLLCIECWDLIISATDGGDYARQNGEAIMLADMGPDAPIGSPGYLRRESMK